MYVCAHVYMYEHTSGVRWVFSIGTRCELIQRTKEPE